MFLLATVYLMDASLIDAYLSSPVVLPYGAQVFVSPLMTPADPCSYAISWISSLVEPQVWTIGHFNSCIGLLCTILIIMCATMLHSAVDCDCFVAKYNYSETCTLSYRGILSSRPFFQPFGPFCVLRLSILAPGGELAHHATGRSFGFF